MPVYDLACEEHGVFVNAIMPYDEMKQAQCPICLKPLSNIPGRFKFDVKDSQRSRRQVLENRFKKREKRIEATMDKAQQERLESWCRKHGARRYY